MGEAIWELATEQGGVLGHQQLLDLGLGDNAIEHLLQNRRWKRLHRGVYLVGHGDVGRRGRYAGAVLACGHGAALSHRSSAVWRGLLRADRGRPDVSVVRGGGRGHRGIAIHRVAFVPSETVEGIPCTTVARTIVDVAGTEDRRTVERCVEGAAIAGVLDVREIAAVLERIERPRGVRTLRAVLTEHVPGSTLTRSELEERMLRLCRDHSLPPCLVNRHVDVGHRLIEIDFCWPDARLAVEVDSLKYHGTVAAMRRDRARDRDLQLAGWTVLRFTEEEILGQPAVVAATIRAALRNEGRDLRK